MFGIGTTELVVILVIALVFLGPKRLPEVAKGLGKALGELRRASQDLRDTIEIEARETHRREIAKTVAASPTPPQPAEGALARDPSGSAAVATADAAASSVEAPHPADGAAPSSPVAATPSGAPSPSDPEPAPAGPRVEGQDPAAR